MLTHTKRVYTYQGGGSFIHPSEATPSPHRASTSSAPSHSPPFARRRGRGLLLPLLQAGHHRGMQRADHRPRCALHPAHRDTPQDRCAWAATSQLFVVAVGVQTVTDRHLSSQAGRRRRLLPGAHGWAGLQPTSHPPFLLTPAGRRNKLAIGALFSKLGEDYSHPFKVRGAGCWCCGSCSGTCAHAVAHQRPVSCLVVSQTYHQDGALLAVPSRLASCFPNPLPAPARAAHWPTA